MARYWNTEVRVQIYKRILAQKGCVPCFVCHQPVAETDSSLEHIWPKSKGGTDRPLNLTISHLKCNGERGNATKWLISSNKIIK